MSLLAAVLFAGCAASHAKPRAAATPPASAFQVSLPGIVVFPATGEVRVDGRTCLEGGILEYLAVGLHGKAYESLFVLDCRPSHLQMALLVAGYQEGELPPPVRGDFSPATGPTGAAAASRPAGAPEQTSPPQEYWSRPAKEPTFVAIDVDIQQTDGSWRRVPVESLLVDRRTGKPPPRLTWAFTGSFFLEDPQTHLEFFAADAEQSLIALWYDPTALLNLAQDVGNPYRGEASGLAVNPSPPVKRGTPVRLVLRPIRAATSAGRPTLPRSTRPRPETPT